MLVNTLFHKNTKRWWCLT